MIFYRSSVFLQIVLVSGTGNLFVTKYRKSKFGSIAYLKCSWDLYPIQISHPSCLLTHRHTEVPHPPIRPVQGESRQHKVKFRSCRIPVHSATCPLPLNSAVCELIHSASWTSLCSMPLTDSLW